MADESFQRSGFSRLRRWGIGLNVLVSCAAVGAIVVMVNYLASRHFVRFSWTGDTRFRLSQETLGVLSALTNQVKVIVLFEPDVQGTLYGDVKALLREYQLASPRIQVELIDYLRNSRAALVKAQYAISSSADADLVIFDYGGRHQIVTARELSDYDLSGAFRGQPVKRTAFKGEQFFTSALLAVTDPKPLQAYALTGHAEHDVASEDSMQGYQKLAGLLREKNIALERLSLHTNDVPEGCSLLLIAGPKTRIPSEELDKIDAYLKKGGRVLALLRNTLLTEGRKSGLEQRLLAEWNVEVGDNLVIDRSQTGAGAGQVLLTSDFGGHPVVNPLQGARLGLAWPRSVRQRTANPQGADAVKVSELVFTSSSGVALANAGGNQNVRETNGVIPLAVAAEKGTVAGVSPDRGATRLVVVGESLFLGNGMIEAEANRDFASLAVNWLLGRGHLLEIGARPLREYQLSLTVGQRRDLRWILLAAMPGSVLFLGLLVWVRRRK